jgi:hypothetical protein
VREHVDLGVDESLRLSSDGGGDLRVSVPGRVDGDAGGEVEVLDAIDGRDPATATVGDLQIGDLEPHVREVRHGHQHYDNGFGVRHGSPVSDTVERSRGSRRGVGRRRS